MPRCWEILGLLKCANARACTQTDDAVDLPAVESAIVQSLLDYKGNKVKAAESLGMSRATIYRKIHEYGIVAPGS